MFRTEADFELYYNSLGLSIFLILYFSYDHIILYNVLLNPSYGTSS